LLWAGVQTAVGAGCGDYAGAAVDASFGLASLIPGGSAVKVASKVAAKTAKQGGKEAAKMIIKETAKVTTKVTEKTITKESGKAIGKAVGKEVEKQVLSKIACTLTEVVELRSAHEEDEEEDEEEGKCLTCVDPWQPVLDPNTGQTYWWNTETQQTTHFGAPKPSSRSVWLQQCKGTNNQKWFRYDDQLVAHDDSLRLEYGYVATPTMFICSPTMDWSARSGNSTVRALENWICFQ